MGFRGDRLIGAAVGLAVVGLGLAGCGDDAAQSRAQAQVAAKEQALADAQAAAVTAKAEFCSASAVYVTALDRYGDLLVNTATTVSDVTDAGSDLAAPREDAIAGAEQAVAAQQDVAAAQAELDAARAAVATSATEEAEDAASSAKAESGSPSPSGTPAAVVRVQQAEADFADAQAGISAATPIVQAGVQFNAAAVALEAAWLSLLGQAGCLSESAQGDAAAAVEKYVSALQDDLKAAGYYDGEVDGVYGPDTAAAIRQLQIDHDLPQTAMMDKATAAALQAELATQGQSAALAEATSTAALQQTLKLAGYWDGPIDGKWTTELTTALEKLQKDLGVEVTGAVDPATISAFEKAIEAAMTPPTATATATKTKTATATATATKTKTATETATTTATATATVTQSPTPEVTASPSLTSPSQTEAP